MEDKLNPAVFGTIIDDIEFQKAYLFYIHLDNFEFYIPSTKQTVILTPKNEFELCTSATSFPIMSTEIQRVGFYNSELKIGKKTTFSDWNATFRLDVNRQSFTAGDLSDTVGMNTYEYFYVWQNLIFDPINRTSLLPNQYKKNISLFLLNEKASVEDSTNFFLEGAFPTQISGGTLDYNSESILTFQVTFAFDRFTLPYIDIFGK